MAAIPIATSLISGYFNKLGADKQAAQASKSLQASEQRRLDAMSALSNPEIAAIMNMLFPGLFPKSASKPVKGDFASGMGRYGVMRNTNPGFSSEAGGMAVQNVLRWLNGQTSDASYQRAQEQSAQGLNAMRSFSAAAPQGGANQAMQQAGLLNFQKARNEAARDQTILEEQARQQGITALMNMYQQAFGLAGLRSNAAAGQGTPQVPVTANQYTAWADAISKLGNDLSKWYSTQQPSAPTGVQRAYDSWAQDRTTSSLFG